MSFGIILTWTASIKDVNSRRQSLQQMHLLDPTGVWMTSSVVFFTTTNIKPIVCLPQNLVASKTADSCYSRITINKFIASLYNTFLFVLKTFLFGSIFFLFFAILHFWIFHICKRPNYQQLETWGWLYVKQIKVNYNRLLNRSVEVLYNQQEPLLKMFPELALQLPLVFFSFLLISFGLVPELKNVLPSLIATL